MGIILYILIGIICIYTYCKIAKDYVTVGEAFVFTMIWPLCIIIFVGSYINDMEIWNKRIFKDKDDKEEK